MFDLILIGVGFFSYWIAIWNLCGINDKLK